MLSVLFFQGTTALHVALRQGNDDMIDYLLSLPKIDVTDCAIYAAKEGDMRTLELILDKLETVAPGLEKVGHTGVLEFSEAITPLIMAAIEGHYSMIGMLLRRGHTIERPHQPDCYCKECM